jgi:hypothetical protein
MPGDNTDMDFTSNINIYSGNLTKAFICWVNRVDSVYTLYLRQTCPDPGKNIIVFSGTSQIANPSIAFTSNLNYDNLRIAWQTHINNHWQILSRQYSNDSFTNVTSITDSLTNNINPGLNTGYIAWIQDRKLKTKYLDSVNAKPYVLDSSDCSNPNVSKYPPNYPAIIYEKGAEGSKQIMEAHYNNNYPSNSEWSFYKLSTGGNSINPRYGVNGYLSFQEFDNGVWKSVYQIIQPDTIKNVSYNCENPEFFAYPIILTKQTSSQTPYFVVYGSDSLKNNKEIIFKSVIHYGHSDTTINLSNAEGDDYLPRISWLILRDTVYIAIYWIHEQNGKKDIWAAYTKYIPQSYIPGIIIYSFALCQNYPNPFNPSTIISWQLAKSSIVTLKIYDVLGNEITTLVNEYQNAGKHSITFDIQQALKHNLSSGIYFYQLKAGSNITAKKMMYLK